MKDRAIVILGGYGTAGRLIALWLLRKTDAKLVIAGRDIEHAEIFAGELNSEFPGERARAEKVDASDPRQLRRSFHDARMVLVASSTSMFTDVIVGAALDSQIDYIDIQYSSSKVAYLKSISRRIEELGLCFITDGGFHPGLPGVMVRWAGNEFDKIEKAVVTSLIRIDWKRLDVGKATIEELLTGIEDYDSSAFIEGRWRKPSFFSSSGYLREDFGAPFGKRYCAPMFLEEMRSLPELYPSLRNAGFYVGGFNWFVDYFVFPVAMVAMKLWPQFSMRASSALMRFGVRRFSRPPYATILKLDAAGLKDGRARELEATLSHEDGYVLTALPIVASLMQYLDGSIRKPGLFTQASIVDPARLIGDMTAMGAVWKVRWKT